MCGRYYLVTSIETIARLFGVDLSRGAASARMSLPPRYNIAPQQMIPVVRAAARAGDEASEREIAPREVAMLSWGFVPSWTSDLREARKPINARCETAASGAMFRGAFAERRCIVPADGWYEWQVDPATGHKTPRLMRVLDGEGNPACFAMAGVWEAWRTRDPDPSRRVEHESCAIITTAAAKACAHVHDRMPAILPAHAIDRWLDPNEKDAGALASLLTPLETAKLSITRVSTRVNSPRNDGAELIEAVSEDAPPELKETPAKSPRGRAKPQDPWQGSLFGG